MRASYADTCVHVFTQHLKATHTIQQQEMGWGTRALFDLEVNVYISLLILLRSTDSLQIRIIR